MVLLKASSYRYQAIIYALEYLLEVVQSGQLKPVFQVVWCYPFHPDKNVERQQ
jgi:hydroxylamine reductase (hybrid-cluster protein)